MPGLAGLTGMYGELDNAPAGRVDDGAYQLLTQGTPDPVHGHSGDTSGETWPAGYGLGYRGQGTYESSGVLAEWSAVGGYDPGQTGGPLDYTPSSHGGAYPRPMIPDVTTLDPDGLAVVGEQARALHGVERGGTVVFYDAPGGHEEPTNTTTDRFDAPNVNALRKAVGQLRGIIGGVGGMGGGSHLGQADVDHGYGQLNDNPEFQAGHSIRVVQHDTMHFDQTGLKSSEEGTWLGKHPVGTNVRFNGPDSPYSTEGEFNGSFRSDRTGYPTEFDAPSAPTVLPVRNGPDVFAWG